MRKSPAPHVLLALMTASAFTGCETTEGQAIGAGLLAGITTAAIVKNNGGDDKEAIAAGLAVGVLTGYLVSRYATPKEKQAVQAQAADSSYLTSEKRQEIKSQDKYVAVPIPQDVKAPDAPDQSQNSVILVDPVTNQPVSDQVYAVPSQSGQSVADGTELNLGGYQAVYVN